MPKEPRWCDHRKEKKEKNLSNNIIADDEQTVTKSSLLDNFVEPESEFLTPEELETLEIIKKSYPKLYSFIQKCDVTNIKQIRFKNANLITKHFCSCLRVVLLMVMSKQ